MKGTPTLWVGVERRSVETIDETGYAGTSRSANNLNGDETNDGLGDVEASLGRDSRSRYTALRTNNHYTTCT